MSMTREDYAVEQAVEELHHEEVMRRATLEQCIYVFVEGQSEEVAIPILFDRLGMDLEENGIIVSHYNGINNLPHVLRLMSQTLSYDRPIIVTYDNDLDGQRITRKISSTGSNVILQTIPSSPVVTFKNGHQGGSFEEAFEPQYFIDTCFQDCFMPNNIVALKQRFLIVFDSSKPWMAQISKFCKTHQCMDFGSCKVPLAEKLAENCDKIPSSFNDLAKLVQQTRLANPVKHPYDVELPKIRGLTC